MPLSDQTLTAATATSLADYTQPSLIITPLRERDVAGIISQLSRALQRDGCVADLLPFYHAALNQELLASSALESGIALPHARLSGVKQLQFAFGRAPEPVNWGPKGAWPVQLVFLLAVPATDAAAYLHLLASLARLAREPERLAQLRAAQDAKTLFALLGAVPVRQG
jgi:mannitol/fructose-specific phosphotransferase system IIA component (Ntr-type)